MNKSIKEGLLEGARVIVLATVSYLLTVGVIDTVVANFAGTRLDVSMQVIVTGLITSALRAVDKWLHEKGKVDNNPKYLGEKGLTGF